MLFDSATSGAAPSDASSGTLVYFTRFLLDDAVTSANNQWSEADVKAAINRSYADLREVSRSFGRTGSTTKRTYATSVADQMYYELPDDVVKVSSLELSMNGSNLSTAALSASDLIYPTPWAAELALQAYNQQDITSVGSKYFLQDEHFGIVAPPTSTEAGTNSIRLLYEASTTELSADGDEPNIPRPYHDLICYKAAVVLRVARDLPANDLASIAADKEQKFIYASRSALNMPEAKITAAGLKGRKYAVKFGRVQR